MLSTNFVAFCEAFFNAEDIARPSRSQKAGPSKPQRREERTEISSKDVSAFFAVLSANFVAFCDDFFHAEDAKVGAESRRESFSSAASALNRVARLFGCGLAALCLGGSWAGLSSA